MRDTAATPLAIGLDLLFLGERSGGVGRYAMELAPALLEAEPGTRITVFTGANAPAELTGAPWAGEARWVRWPVRSDQRRHLAFQMLAGPAVSAARRLDVLHSPGNAGALASPGVTRLVTVHDLIAVGQGAGWDPRAGVKRAARTLPLMSARRSHRVITDSEASKADLVQMGGLDPGCIDVVPLGVRARDDVAATGEAQLRERLGVGTGPIVAGIAQKRPYKNLVVLVRALAELADEEAWLVLPGEPTAYEDELRALAAELGVAERVRFPDWLSDPDLEGLYRAAAVVAVPSLHEGFGLPVLEAMARGAPVACSNTTSLPEVAGDAALQFDPLDQAQVTAAVGRLLRDRGLAADLARRGRERAATFTWRRTAQLTLDSYRRAIAAT